MPAFQLFPHFCPQNTAQRTHDFTEIAAPQNYTVET